jgi:hypothetical protein
MAIGLIDRKEDSVCPKRIFTKENPPMSLHAQHDADVALKLIAREDARQDTALRLYQHRNQDKPVVSRGVALWALMAVIIAVAVVLGLVVRP